MIKLSSLENKKMLLIEDIPFEKISTCGNCKFYSGNINESCLNNGGYNDVNGKKTFSPTSKMTNMGDYF